MFLTITDRSDIQALLSEVNSFLNSHNVEKIKKMEAHTIISEIIYNIKKYTPKGSVKFSLDGDILNIYAQDNGSGIDDVHKSLKDGYSTSGTLGLGFASIFRLADEVDIETSDHGTKIEIKKRMR